MSSSHDHAAEVSHGYGGGRTSRPLLALIPIGILMAVCLAMLAGGVKVMTTPADTSAGVDSTPQAVASAGAHAHS